MRRSPERLAALVGRRHLVEPEVVVLGAVDRAHVDPQVARPSEELVADVTLVLLQPRVSLQVPLQLPFSDEPFPALLADERLLLGVREAVELQVVVELEALVAYGTDVLLLVLLVEVVDGDPGGVALEVLLQVVEVREHVAANVAHAGALVGR